MKDLQQLRPYIKNLTIHQGDYRDVSIPANSLVYCDPPYIGTEGYADIAFDHEQLYKWLRKLNQQAYISEYTMPNDFKEQWSFKVKKLFSGTNKGHATERVFVHEKWAKERETHQQLTLF